jgi:hypothetical protein
MTKRLLVIVTLAIGAASLAARGKPTAGQWTSDARALTRSADFTRDLTVNSPNQRIALCVTDGRLSVVGNTPLSRKRLGVETLSEVLWAPDSAAFAITSSDGGLVGTWSTAVFRIRDGVIYNPARLALKEFSRQFPTNRMSDSAGQLVNGLGQSELAI